MLQGDSWATQAMNKRRTFDVIGLADAASTVSLNGSSSGVYRRGQYYQKALSVTNSSAPVWQSVTNTAINGGSSNNVIGNVYVAQTPENYGYDLDGNQTNDGRWSFTWTRRTGW